ncbi:MAG: ABC transporter permease subunit [Verrucomicrobiota bacterium]
MSSSFLRIMTIAENTLTESLRQRVLHLILLVGIVFIFSSLFISDLSVQMDRFKLLKDIGYAGLSLTGLVISLLSTAQLIPGEIEKKTIYTTLSKPIWRFEYVIGKYLGLVCLITLVTVSLAVIIYLVLLSQEAMELCFRQQIGFFTWLTGSYSDFPEPMRDYIHSIQSESRDSGLFLALLLVWAKLCVITVIAVFFSTFATSTAFIVWNTLLIMFIGHLQYLAKMHWLYNDLTSNALKLLFIAVVGWIIPDFEIYNLIDDVILGKYLPWKACFDVLWYSALYISIMLVLSALIFEEREL